MELSPTLGASAMARLDELALFSQENGALTRLYLTPEHRAATDRVAVWMREAGMAVHMDDAATVVGRYEGVRPGLPAVLLASHIDTVRNAGKYDGCYGVVGAIEAVGELHRRGERLPFAIEVLAFGDEEGSRFPVTLTGSRAVTGSFDPDSLGLADAANTTLEQALRDFGLDPARIPAIARRPGDVLAYLELHIEQGPVLESEGLAVGVVTGISGARRFRVRVYGSAGHAGTVPMGMRHDALSAAAEMTLAVERVCGEEEGLVGTVGFIEVKPGTVNVIPGECRFTIDLRAGTDAQRDRALDRLIDAFEEIARRRRVVHAKEPMHTGKACLCSPGLIEHIAASVAAEGHPVRKLASGAGHDAMAFAGRTPVGMIFIRCKGGISHNPAESITTDDAEAGIRVLLHVLRHLDPTALAV